MALLNNFTTPLTVQYLVFLLRWVPSAPFGEKERECPTSNIYTSMQQLKYKPDEQNKPGHTATLLKFVDNFSVSSIVLCLGRIH